MICRLPGVCFADGMGYELYATELLATRPEVFEILESVVETNRLIMQDTMPARAIWDLSTPVPLRASGVTEGSWGSIDCMAS